LKAEWSADQRTLGSPRATTTIQGDQIPAPAQEIRGVIKENAKDSKTGGRQPSAAKGAPSSKSDR